MCLASGRLVLLQRASGAELSKQRTRVTVLSGSDPVDPATVCLCPWSPACPGKDGMYVYFLYHLKASRFLLRNCFLRISEDGLQET